MIIFFYILSYVALEMYESVEICFDIIKARNIFLIIALTIFEREKHILFSLKFIAVISGEPLSFGFQTLRSILLNSQKLHRPNILCKTIFLLTTMHSNNRAVTTHPFLQLYTVL